MATASLQASPAGRLPASDTFSKALFSQEVTGWLQRASAADKERFEQAFSSIKALADQGDAVVEPRLILAPTPGVGELLASRVPKGSAPASTWSYTATKGAINRSGRPATALARTPNKASSNGGAIDETASSSGGSKAGQDRELASFAAARQRRLTSTTPVPGAGPSEDRPQAAAQPEQATALAPDCTTYQESFNLRDYYPGLYERALLDTRADPVKNYTLISEYGDSLRAGADEAARLHMKSTYTAVNEEVHKARTDADAVKEAEYFKWMMKQRTYYGDLLKAGKVKELEAQMAAATPEQKRALLEVLRQVHAVVNPDQWKSHSQAVHCLVQGPEDPEAVALLKAITKAKTMGASAPPPPHARPKTAGGMGGSSMARPGTAELRPKMVSLGFGQSNATSSSTSSSATSSSAITNVAVAGQRRRPASANCALQPTLSSSVSNTANASARPATAGPQRPKPQRETVKKETFTSKVPLKWAVGSGNGPSLSTYIESFGGGKYSAGKERPSSALFAGQAIKYREVTCPFGAVNPVTAMAPFRTAYPVASCFVSGPSLSQGTGDATVQTTYRQGFAPREPEAVVRSLKAAGELMDQSRKALLRSTLPMPPCQAGVVMLKDSEWKSEYEDGLGADPGPVDVTGNYRQAQAVKKMFNVPTASVGKVAGVHMQLPGQQ